LGIVVYKNRGGKYSARNWVSWFIKIGAENILPRNWVSWFIKIGAENILPVIGYRGL
jgi:hypothetical protein